MLSSYVFIVFSFVLAHGIIILWEIFLFRALTRLSQKFPKADFVEVSKLVTDLAKVHKECCHGDLLECADDRVRSCWTLCVPVGRTNRRRF